MEVTANAAQVLLYMAFAFMGPPLIVAFLASLLNGLKKS